VVEEEGLDSQTGCLALAAVISASTPISVVKPQKNAVSRSPLVPTNLSAKIR